MKKVTVTMRHGIPTIQTTGFEGNSCLDATEQLKTLLAGEGGVDIEEMKLNETKESAYAH